MPRYTPNNKEEYWKRDYVFSKRKLQFESDKNIKWDDLIITFLFGILFISLIMLCFAPWGR